jgi:glycosyltransferase involved in cell wall biosynthesis
MHRLVFAAPGVIGGVRSYLTNLAAFLKSKGIDFKVLLYCKSAGIQTKLEVDHSSHLALLQYSRYSTLKSVYESIGKCIQKDDVVICNDSLELEAINYLQLRNPVVYVLHGDLNHYNSVLRTYQGIIDKVFCVSKGLRDKYSRLYPDLSFDVCYPLVKDIPDEITYDSKSSLVAIFIGRFEYMKGADDFVTVVNESIARNLPVSWRVYTTAFGKDNQLLSKLPSSVKVEIDSPNEEVLTALKAADLLIFPSRSEGFGIAVLEAMKCGVIPIARNLPIGIPDMVINNESGYLIDNAADILTIIEKLTRDSRELNKMKRLAKLFSDENFEYEKSGFHFVESINRVLQQAFSRKRQFIKYKERAIEWFLPEFIYRSAKYLHNKVKY